MKTIALFKPFQQPEETGKSKLAASYWNARYNRANPRNEAYMKQVLETCCPKAKFINVNDNANWQGAIKEAEDIILLYPDSTGLEFREIEKNIPPEKEILILNGRKRFFRKNNIINLQLTLRRFCENYLIGEILFAAVFALLTPIFLLIDLAKGRK